MNGLQRSKKIPLRLIGLCAVSLTACAPPSVRTVYAPPPEALTSPCPPPQAVEIETNADLVRYAAGAYAAWQRCAAQVDALRAFFDESIDAEE